MFAMPVENYKLVYKFIFVINDIPDDLVDERRMLNWL
jgi:hypothetical protein